MEKVESITKARKAFQDADLAAERIQILAEKLVNTFKDFEAQRRKAFNCARAFGKVACERFGASLGGDMDVKRKLAAFFQLKFGPVLIEKGDLKTIEAIGLSAYLARQHAAALALLQNTVKAPAMPYKLPDSRLPDLDPNKKTAPIQNIQIIR